MTTPPLGAIDFRVRSDQRIYTLDRAGRSLNAKLCQPREQNELSLAIAPQMSVTLPGFANVAQCFGRSPSKTAPPTAPARI